MACNCTGPSSGGSCSCSFDSTGTVTVAGSGSDEDPFVVSVHSQALSIIPGAVIVPYVNGSGAPDSPVSFSFEVEGATMGQKWGKWIGILAEYNALSRRVGVLYVVDPLASDGARRGLTAFRRPRVGISDVARAYAGQELVAVKVLNLFTKPHLTATANVTYKNGSGISARTIEATADEKGNSALKITWSAAGDVELAAAAALDVTVVAGGKISAAARVLTTVQSDSIQMGIEDVNTSVVTWGPSLQIVASQWATIFVDGVDVPVGATTQRIHVRRTSEGNEGSGDYMLLSRVIAVEEIRAPAPFSPYHEGYWVGTVGSSTSKLWNPPIT